MCQEEKNVKLYRSLALTELISFPPSAYQGQMRMGMNHGIGVRSQDHAVPWSEACNHLTLSSASVSPNCKQFHYHHSVLPFCKCKFALWQNKPYLWCSRFRHPKSCVCFMLQVLRKPKKKPSDVYYWLFTYVIRAEKNRKGKLAAHAAKRPGSG